MKQRSVYLQRLTAMAPSVAGCFAAVLLFTITGCGSKEGQSAAVNPPVNGVSGQVEVDGAGDAATAGKVQQAQQDAAAQQARMNSQAAAGYAAAAAAHEKSGGK